MDVASPMSAPRHLRDHTRLQSPALAAGHGPVLAATTSQSPSIRWRRYGWDLTSAPQLQRHRSGPAEGPWGRRRSRGALPQGGLLLQRFRELIGALLQLLEEARIAIAITAWSAKVSESAICRSENGERRACESEGADRAP